MKLINSNRKTWLENLFIASVMLIWALVVLPGTIEGLNTAETDVVYEQDFTLGPPFSRWPTHQPIDDNDAMWLADGAYRMRAKEAFYALAPRPLKIENVSVEVDATRAGAEEIASWGIVCRDSFFAAGTYYYLGVLSDGRSMIAKSVSNEFTVLSVGDPSEAVNANTNRIRGDCVGTTLTLYINDRKLIEVDDRELTSGRVGLYVESANVIFDNFRVRAPRQ